jgi:hypothetical protein
MPPRGWLVLLEFFEVDELDYTLNGGAPAV